MEHKDKKLEKLIDKLMASDRMESPSKDFVSKIMSGINLDPIPTSITYKPLISKSAWLVLTLVVLTLVGYIYFNEPNSNIGWLPSLDLSKLNPLNGIDLDVSKTTLYAIVLFAAMMSIQVPLLKNYFNKRLEF